MTKAIAHTYTIAHEYRRQINLALMAACLVFALGYAINLYRVISHTITLQHMNSQSVALSADIQKLDSQYLSVVSKITVDNLSSYGFTQGQVSEFVSRSSSLGRVAMAAHEL